MTIKVVFVENGTYKCRYYELQSNRRRLGAPFGFSNLKDAVDKAIEFSLPEMTQTPGDC